MLNSIAGQDEFEHLHSKFKAYDWPVSEKPIWIGRFGEAIFWLEETGEQQVPIKFATKASWHYGVDGAALFIFSNEANIRRKIL